MYLCMAKRDFAVYYLHGLLRRSTNETYFDGLCVHAQITSKGYS